MSIQAPLGTDRLQRAKDVLGITTLEAATPVTNAGAQGVVTAGSYTAAKAAVDTATNIVHILGLGTFEATTESVTGASAGNPENANEHDGVNNLVFEVSTGVFKLFSRQSSRIRVDAKTFDIKSGNSGSVNRSNFATALALTSQTGAELVFTESEEIDFTATVASNPSYCVDAPENSHIVIQKNCTLHFDSPVDDGGVNQIFLRLRSNSSITGLGTIKGDYTSALEGEIKSLSFKSGHSLVVLNIGTKAEPTEKVLIQGVTIGGAFATALRIGSWTKGIKIQDVTFTPSYSSLYIHNGTTLPAGSNLDDIPYLKNITVERCYFDRTYHTNPNLNADVGGTWEGQLYPGGGNTVSCIGGIENLNFYNNYLEPCGRRAFEGLPDLIHANTDYTIEEQKQYVLRRSNIEGNYLSKSGARTFTLFCLDTNIERNEIHGNTSIETTWVNTKFHKNKVFMNFAHDAQTSLNPVGKFVTLKGRANHQLWIYENEYHVGMPDYGVTNLNMGMFGIFIRSRGVEAYRNKIFVYNQQGNAALRLLGCSDIDFTDNEIIRIDNNSSITTRAVLASTSRNVRVNRNRVIFDYSYAGNTTISGIFTAENVDNFECDGNTIDLRNPDRLTSADANVIAIAGESAATLYSRIVFAADGESYTRTVLSGIASAPPSSPATDSVYMIRNYPAPSGAWSGKAGQFATWNGTAWTYQIISGYIWEAARVSDTFNRHEIFLPEYLPEMAVDFEKEFTNWVQNNKVYLLGPVIKNVKITNNTILFNNHHVAQPTRMYNAFSLAATVLDTAIENLDVRGNNFALSFSETRPLSISPDSYMNIEYETIYKSDASFVPGQQAKIPGSRIRLLATRVGHPTLAITDGSTWHYSGQMGYRSNAGSPIGSVTPYFSGEQLFDSTNNNWYRSYGTSNTQWALMGA